MKKIWIMAVLILLMCSTTVSAHTALEKSVPSDGATVTEELNEIVLEFNTALEKGSNFTVENQEGEEVPFNVQLLEQSMIGNPKGSMSDGDYTVEWKIIGADGHPIEGVFSFTAKTGEVKKTEDTEEQNTDSLSEVPTEETQTLETDQQTSETTSSPPYAVIIIFIILAIIAAGTFMWALERRKVK